MNQATTLAQALVEANLSHTGIQSFQPKQASKKLGRHHFAFFRGHLEGIPLERLGALYLPEDIDFRVVKSTLTWIQGELAVLAKRNGHPSLRRLTHLKIHEYTAVASAVKEEAPPRRLPTIDEWAVEKGIEDFYNYSDLTKLYQAEFFGSLTRKAEPTRSTTKAVSLLRIAERNTRLRKQQRELVYWLETLASADPVPQDPLAAWLSDGTVERLAAAGLHTFQELIDFIRKFGSRWYDRVPRMGEAGAERLVEWIREKPSLGELPARFLESSRGSKLKASPLPSPILQSEILVRRPPSELALTVSLLPSAVSVPTIAPIERFQWPITSAAGTEWAYVGKPWKTDLEALNAWLATLTNEATARAARLQTERLLLWAVLLQQVPASQLEPSHLAQFERFLLAPPEAWVCRRGTWRWSDDWRPFYGALSPSSAQTALGYARMLFRWWQDNKYILLTPW